MSIREEDTSKTSSSGRGLAVAAAAIGVGVGAALYYFFNKQTESPDGEGSTTQWETAQQLRSNQSAQKSEVFRNRTWTLEECSICFEVLLQEKEEMELPCTHRFHTACILPWLQTRQTCPICRKKV